MKILAMSILGLCLVGTPHLFAGGGKHWHKVLQELDLSEDQKASIRTIHEASRDEHRALRNKSHEAREAFNQSLGDSDIGNDRLAELHEEMIEAKNTMMRAKFEKMIKVREILNPEQRSRFQALMAKHRGKGRYGAEMGPSKKPANRSVIEKK